MAVTIRSVETERLARAVAKETGESLTDAITTALKERLERLQQRKHADEKIRGILKRVDRLPRLDNRSPDEILAYDKDGLPR